MKTNSFLKKGPLFLLVGIAVLLVSFAYYGLGFGANIVDVTGPVMATTVLSGTVTEQSVRESGSPLDENYISQKITEIKPSRTPLDTLLRSVPSQKINSFITEYYAVDMRSFSATTNAEYTAPTPLVRTAAIPVASSAMYGPTDTIVVPTIAGANTSDGFPLVLFVDSVAAGSITVYSLNGPAIASGADAGKPGIPTIPDGTVLRRMGNAHNELDMQTAVISNLPDKLDNNCQIFMAQIEESTFQKMNQKEVPWGFADFDRMSLVDMKIAMEMSYIQGFKNIFKHPVTGKIHYMCGGITRSGIQYLTTAASNSITPSDYTGWQKALFTGNGGSETRYMFAGGDFLKGLQLVDEVSKQLNANTTKTVFGITFNQIVTNFGVLYVNYNHVMDLAGLTRHGLVLDMNNIEKHENMALTSEDLDLKAAGIRRADAKVITESSCVVVRYPETHGLIYLKP